jgi:hypothetical protein
MEEHEKNIHTILTKLLCSYLENKSGIVSKNQNIKEKFSILEAKAMGCYDTKLDTCN